MESLGAFELFPSWLLLLSIFLCAYWPSVLIYLLWRNVNSDPLLIFKLGWSFYCHYKSSLHNLDTRLSYIIFKCFLPFCGLSFYFLDSILWSTNVLNVEEIQFIFLFACTFGDVSKILLPNPTHTQQGNALQCHMQPSKTQLDLNVGSFGGPQRSLWRLLSWIRAEFLYLN